MNENGIMPLTLAKIADTLMSKNIIAKHVTTSATLDGPPELFE